MANAIHQWIDAVTTRVEDQRRALDRVARELVQNNEHTSALREAVARLEAKVDTCDRMVQAQLDAIKEQVKEDRKHVYKMLAGALGAIGTLASALHLFVGN